MTNETNRANTGAGEAVPTRIYLDLLSRCANGHGAIATRRCCSAPLRDEGTAVAIAIALLKQHAELCGFILVPDGLQAANDAYLHKRTITRATMARKACQSRKQAEAGQ